MRLKHHHQRQNLGPSSSSGGNPTVLALVPAARPEIEMYSGISGLPPLACAARQEGHRRDLRVGSLGLLLASREWSPELATEADGCRQRRGGGSHREPARLGLGCCDLPLSLLERARLRCWVMQSRPRLYFVRHGRSTHNESQEERPLIWDAPLHKIGLRQAAKLRGRLRHVPLELCVSSPLRRALQTALVALGDWAPLAPGCEAAVEEGRATVVSVEVTLLARERRLRFDAHPGDFSEPLEGGLGPGAEVRLARAVRLQGAERPLGAGTACTVTGVPLRGAAALPRPGGAHGARAWPGRERRPRHRRASAARALPLGGLLAAARGRPRLVVEQPRRRGLGRRGGLPGPLGPGRLRGEPRADFRARVGRLVRHLTDLAARHAHVAVFAHCWVLEDPEIWRQQFGRGRRFGNAELAVVEVAAGGSWAWLRRGHGLPRDSSESSGGQLQQPQQQRQPLEQPRPRPRRRSERRRLGGAARWKRPCSLPPP
ncbi:unnamed protein product, partial [Prorocentrum cordatum]